jgi:hypothetical protein
MSCKHLKELYEMCVRNNVKLGSTDLIRLVCSQCGVEEECPSLLYAAYESRHAGDLNDGPDGGVAEPEK